MPFRPIQPPRPGSIDLAARRIYEMLDREERQRMRRAKPGRSLRPPVLHDVKAPAAQGLFVAHEPSDAPSSPIQLAGHQPDPTEPIPYKPVPLQRRHRSLPMPDTRHSAVTPDEWYAFHDAVRRSGMRTEAEIEAARTTFGHEGGMTVDPSAGGPGNPGVAGMTLRTMTDARERRLSGQLEVDPSRLSVEDVAHWYDVYMDDALRNVGGSAALAEIRDRKLANAIFDTLFQHGPNRGALVVQRGVNAVIDSLSDEVRDALGVAPIEMTDPDAPRTVGPTTLGLIKRLVDAGYTGDLREAVATSRTKYQRDRKQVETPARHDSYR